MKLLMDARNLGSKPSGVGMYAYNWIKALEEYNDVEIHVIVDVLESGQIKSLNSDSKVHVHCMGTFSNKSAAVFKYFKYVQQVIDDVKPDIFWEINNLAPVKLSNPHGKYIVTIHDMFPLTMPECFGRIYPYYFRYGVWKTINNVDAIVYNSNCTNQDTERFFPKAKNKTNFISYNIIPPIPEMEVEQNDYFLYMGNLEKRKGVDILLDAYELYVQQGGQRELVIAGKVREDDIGVQLERMEAKLSGLHYMGYANDEMRTRLYRECGCFVFPSRAEGFGMPVIEAMQCGKPVITSDLPIFDELVGNVVKSFSLKGDDDDCKRLSVVLGDYDANSRDMVDVQSIKAVAHKYGSDALAERFVEFLKEI